jgi:uncharacterized protein Usg
MLIYDLSKKKLNIHAMLWVQVIYIVKYLHEKLMCTIEWKKVMGSYAEYLKLRT